eukprot:9997711-Alexandrium_andersonii.AAC.1
MVDFELSTGGTAERDYHGDPALFLLRSRPSVNEMLGHFRAIVRRVAAHSWRPDDVALLSPPKRAGHPRLHQLAFSTAMSVTSMLPAWTDERALNVAAAVLKLRPSLPSDFRARLQQGVLVLQPVTLNLQGCPPWRRDEPVSALGGPVPEPAAACTVVCPRCKVGILALAVRPTAGMKGSYPKAHCKTCARSVRVGMGTCTACRQELRACRCSDSRGLSLEGSAGVQSEPAGSGGPRASERSRPPGPSVLDLLRR